MDRKKETIKHYTNMAEKYTKNNFTTDPMTTGNIRMNKTKRIFKQASATTVLDIGCADGYMMINLTKNGFNSFGLDYTPKMVDITKQNLSREGFNSDNACLCDIEIDRPFEYMLFEGASMYGALVHAEDETTLLTNVRKVLKSGGTLLCECRNELMSVFGGNEYTQRFFLNLVDVEQFTEPLQSDIRKYYSQFVGCNSSAPWKAKYQSRMHNPFTVEKLFRKSGFSVKQLHFFYFHCLPTHFEEKYPEEYKKCSNSLEGTDDWRGYLMAATFIVEAIAI
jgi:SAM-dependent methyltransferase